MRMFGVQNRTSAWLYRMIRGKPKKRRRHFRKFRATRSTRGSTVLGEILFLCSVLLTSVLLINASGGLPRYFKIGVIFTERDRDSMSEWAFKYAIDAINKNSSLLPHTTLIYDIQFVPEGDSFRAEQTVCGQLERGAQVIFGPADPVLSSYIQSVCSALDVPHLSSHRDVPDIDRTEDESSFDLSDQSQQFVDELGRPRLPSAARVHPSATVRNRLLSPSKKKPSNVPKKPRNKATRFKHGHHVLPGGAAQGSPSAASSNAGLKYFRPDLPTHQYLDMNLFPSQTALNDAYSSLVKFMNWTNLAIIYEDDMGLIQLQGFIRSFEEGDILVRQGNPETFVEILNTTKHKDFYNMIIDVRKESMLGFFQAADALDMNDYKYHFLFTDFDMESFEMAPQFRHNLVNMTAFRLVEFDRGDVKGTLREVEEFRRVHRVNSRSSTSSSSGRSLGTSTSARDKLTRPAATVADEDVFLATFENPSRVLETEAALMLDGLSIFVKGLEALNRSTELKTSNLSCERVIPWEHGPTLFNYMNSVRLHGLTGDIEFSEGRRTSVKLDILKLKPADLVKVGEWTPESGINLTNPAAFYDVGQFNVTLKVVTIEEVPYVMFDDSGNVTGNARFRGFCVDMLKAISNLVGFHYELKLVEDGLYGIKDPETGKWNGMVGELIDKKADLAVGPMTITYIRESVIDFTKPFRNLGISILFKVPERRPTQLFSFMNPIGLDIWLYVLAAYVLVSVTLFLVARLSPYEWYNPHPCMIEYDVLHNQFTLANCFWYSIGTLMQQCDLNPVAGSTRLVGAIWWFFTLIIISSYTANLAAFLTVERMITPIESAEDLADQNSIEYGTVKAGSTMTFFRDSKIETYAKMWRFMQNRKPNAFVNTYDDGIQRVLQGNYAFLMESTMLDYVVQRNCNLTQIGGLLDSKGYGIATSRGSPWTDILSLAILDLQEKGVIPMLYNKWWKNTGDTCKRDTSKNKEDKASALGVDNVGGVFVVLLCGLAVSVLIAILEFCWNSKKNAQNDRQSLCSELGEELCFAIRCCGSSQRPALKRQCTRCVPPHSYRLNGQADTSCLETNGFAQSLYAHGHPGQNGNGGAEFGDKGPPCGCEMIQ